MKISNFQLIFTGIFVAFIVFGVLAFAFFTTKSSSVGIVRIWGTLDQAKMEEVINTMKLQSKAYQDVVYEQKSSSTYTSEVISAMASGVGPDIILLSQDQIANFADKVDTIPYATIPQSTYLASYINEGGLFLNSQGALALPFTIDPLVMYWNRDLFTNAGLAQPPQYWDDLLTEAQKFTVLDGSSNIKRSAIALGSWDNIPNAKSILSSLFMQTGDRIVGWGPTGSPQSVFGQTPTNAAENPAASALQFYTQFANPSKVTYSWNRSLPNSNEAFTAGNLGMYVGFASEHASIAARNPNLNFSLAVLPQIKGNSTSVTFGRLTGLAIPRTASNPLGALTVAQGLAGPVGTAAAANGFNLPSVRLDAVQNTSSSAAADVLYRSALISQGWLDPEPAATDAIFKSMIDSVTSNKSDPSSAVQDASDSMQALFGTQ